MKKFMVLQQLYSVLSFAFLGAFGELGGEINWLLLRVLKMNPDFELVYGLK